jgi:hypothetical protein
MEKSSINEASAKGKGAFDAFLNLLSLITLGWLAHAFGAVCFQLINKYLGDLNSYVSSASYYGGMLKYGIASLVVITPVYFLAVNLLHRSYKKGELSHDSGIYKWLTYLMLLISSLTIIGSVIALITNFLDGNYTLPFILKMITVIAIAGIIFGYYLYDLRRNDYAKKDKVSLIAGIIVILAVVTAIIGGFLSVETPMQARIRQEDEKVTRALNEVYYFINNSYYSTQKLEETYDFEVIFSGYDFSADNVAYRKVSEEEYELCTEFKGSGVNQLYGDKAIPWIKHEAGYQCYVINVKKEYDKNYKSIQRVPIEEEMGATAPAVKQ